MKHYICKMTTICAGMQSQHSRPACYLQDESNSDEPWQRVQEALDSDHNSQWPLLV